MDFENLHQILRSLYDEMMPLCEDMAGVAKGIAGLGALFYVAYRVWQSLARAEPIDVFPMLRPFAIGLCIMFFPTVVLGTLSGVLSPIVQGTAQMLEAETLDMNEYREQKDKLEYEAMKRNPETAYLVSNEEFDKQLEELGWSPDDLVTMAGMYIERSMYQMKKGVRDFFRELLALLLQKNYYDAGRQADRGIKATKLFVTANVMMPSVLTEVGFMSNREDEIYLASETGQQEIARMLFNALMEYYTTTQGKTYKKTLKTLRHSNGTRSGVDALRLEVKERTAKRKDKEQPAKKEEPVVQNPPKASDNPEKKDTLATADNRAQQPLPADAQESSTAIPVFSIQLFSNSTEMKPDDKRLKGVSPVTFVKVGDTFKCLYQGTTDYQQAKEQLKKVREKFPDAFIVAYLGEKPISTAEALELVRRAR